MHGAREIVLIFTFRPAHVAAPDQIRAQCYGQLVSDN
jgi:hypothetical protein